MDRVEVDTLSESFSGGRALDRLPSVDPDA
jgi:hypothetical protein